MIKVYEREKSFGEIVLREHFLKEAREAIKVIGMPDYMLKYEERVIRKEEFEQMLEKGMIEEAFTVGKWEPLNVKIVK